MERVFNCRTINQMTETVANTTFVHFSRDVSGSISFSMLQICFEAYSSLCGMRQLIWQHVVPVLVSSQFRMLAVHFVRNQIRDLLVTKKKNKC